MTDAPDISACIALAREAKDDIDDVVRLAGSAKEWNNVQDLADAVLALAERVRELECGKRQRTGPAPRWWRGG